MAAWRAYLDNLSQTITPDNQTYVFGERDRLFVDLLFRISSFLGYPFTPTDIKNSTYRPTAHGDLEMAQLKVMGLLAKMADGQEALPVRSIVTTEQAAQLEALLKLLAGMANGTAAWPIRDVDKSATDGFK